MSETTDEFAEVPAIPHELRLVTTHEGASAFPVDDPFVRLVFTYGSFLPGAETFYSSPEEVMLQFIDAVRQAGQAHPALALQYAAWLRDPRKGKGNRSQPPWVLAVLASLPSCITHPRFVELVSKCVVRPDDALSIMQAATLWLGDNQLPRPLQAGIAGGLESLSDYQLTKYANARLNLLPRKKQRRPDAPALPEPEDADETALVPTTTTAVEAEGTLEKKERTLRLVDVLGICKRDLSPRLFALYRYLHAPTRERDQLLPLLESQLPLFGKQRDLRLHPPRELSQVGEWVGRALEARMTMEQLFSATGMAQGQRQQLRALKSPAQPASDQEQQPERRELPEDTLEQLRQGEIKQVAMRAELWKALLDARVPSESDLSRAVPFLGDIAFLRNVRGMYQAGVPVSELISEARRRQFAGVWPFQLLSAARTIEHGKRRGQYRSEPCPGVLPVLDAMFEQVALAALPRKQDGVLYRMLGLADVSGSMGVRLGTRESSATCMDAALAFTIAFSYTTRTQTADGLAGTWDNSFHPVLASPGDGPLALAKKIEHSGGMGGGGTQIFGSIMGLINWLVEHPHVARPEVLLVLSDMQFHPPSEVSPSLFNLLPWRYRGLVLKSAFRQMPPLAAAAVLYREVLGSDVSLVLWNLASYEGAPAPSGMERVLMLSGFDANSFRIIEQWLQAGSPGTAMPTNPQDSPAGLGQSGSSFEAVLAALRRY